MSTPLTVIAAFQALPGKEEELRIVLNGLIAPTRQEKGCLNYDLHRSTDDSSKFLFHENWTDKAALDAHLQSPHIKALLPRAAELCASPAEVTLWNRVG